MAIVTWHMSLHKEKGVEEILKREVKKIMKLNMTGGRGVSWGVTEYHMGGSKLTSS